MSKYDATRIIIVEFRVTFQIVASLLTDDFRGIVYYRNMFVVQATSLIFENKGLPINGSTMYVPALL
jgi:hypothetical protein